LAPLSLHDALPIWRDRRAPQLADLIDAIAAKCETTAIGRDKHRQWLDAAAVYDPVVAGELCAAASHRAHRGDSEWKQIIERFGESDAVIGRIVERDASPLSSRELPRHQRNRVERLAAVARWPEDPRVAKLLAHWFTHDAFSWDWPFEAAGSAFLEIVAEELERIADVRVVASLETCIDRPYSRTPALRELQQALAPRVITSIDARARAISASEAEQVGAWLQALASPSSVIESSVDERELWRACAREPLSTIPRMVLADYLLDRGDARGELIALQSSTTDHLANQKLAEHWNEWLGQLALVLHRKSRFEIGTLADAVIGLKGTPEWAWGAVGAHRELVTMQRVAASRYATGEQFATFLDSLVEPMPLVELEPRLLDGLADMRTRSAIRHAAYHTDDDTRWRDRFIELFPALETLEIRALDAETIITALPGFRRLRSLRRIIVEVPRWNLDEDDVERLKAACRSIPIVELHL
jgi:uncharacterized protein (TIGR02996 family)